MADNTYDVLIIGAGISGINAAYRIQSSLPNHTYKILEARGGLGGTWDFWKYPGIRSDSDLYTFGFPWKPWAEQHAIADGATINKYLHDTAAEQGIDKHIQYHSRVTGASWSSETQRWRLAVSVNGEKEAQYYSKYIMMCSGYYDYNEPLAAKITGLENFKGTIIHPQFWPEDLDYADKRVAIVGSGATAVTLLPSMAEKAKRMTMVQRSPGYLITLPQTTPLQRLLHAVLPGSWFRRFVRFNYLLLPWLFFNFCRSFPNVARKVMHDRTVKELPKNVPHDPHFHPYYNPWEQRMCACPDGDFFQALRGGRAAVATGQIKTMTDDAIVMEDGERIEADIVVTATGLKIQMAGGITPNVDGNVVRIGDKFIWKGMMLQDLPNCAFVIGYTNASWTLGADAAAQHFVRIVKDMEKRGQTSVRPIVAEGESLKEMPVLNLNSTYVKKGASQMPKTSDRAPWKNRVNYFSDIVEAKYGDIRDGLEFQNVKAE